MRAFWRVLQLNAIIIEPPILLFSATSANGCVSPFQRLHCTRNSHVNYSAKFCFVKVANRLFARRRRFGTGREISAYVCNFSRDSKTF